MVQFRSCVLLAFVLAGCGGGSFLVFGEEDAGDELDAPDTDVDAGDVLELDTRDAGELVDTRDVLELDTRDAGELDTRDTSPIDTAPPCGAKGAACVSAVDCCTMYCAGVGICSCAAKGAVCTVSKQCCSGSCTPPYCD